jgi:hypothetical protein
LLRRGGGAICRGMMEFRPSVQRKALGISLLALGVLGLVLPFLQGFLFLALGTFVLRDQYAWAYRGMAWIRGKWPSIIPAIEAREQQAIAWSDRQWVRVRGWLRLPSRP